MVKCKTAGNIRLQREHARLTLYSSTLPYLHFLITNFLPCSRKGYCPFRFVFLSLDLEVGIVSHLVLVSTSAVSDRITVSVDTTEPLTVDPCATWGFGALTCLAVENRVQLKSALRICKFLITHQKYSIFKNKTEKTQYFSFKERHNAVQPCDLLLPDIWLTFHSSSKGVPIYLSCCFGGSDCFLSFGTKQ